MSEDIVNVPMRIVEFVAPYRNDNVLNVFGDYTHIRIRFSRPDCEGAEATHEAELINPESGTTAILNEVELATVLLEFFIQNAKRDVIQ